MTSLEVPNRIFTTWRFLQTMMKILTTRKMKMSDKKVVEKNDVEKADSENVDK